ncbi:MAG: [NiFe]-hydrogenase assembly chaperone HybE [Rhodospirillum sp.]|nr:[NiFe]-hydrogenase assembly chaperone HybE [Rhodospirillum sp.]MCF8490996.1 [NiFe]-hydrogenase assembly chaperone HybE [Rhodospirillum sp.]MCF8499485.1 [NiFe]-hydrogenase assembly chaperone HybE [Rhodospirillum sp.]
MTTPLSHSTARNGFEGSYLGSDSRISPRATLECKICWTPYDPAFGDETRQIEPGTAFLDLPADWTCPNCGGAKEQFMVLEDPGRGEEGILPASTPECADLVNRLVAEFRDINIGKMRDVPFRNKALSVEAVGFQPWEGHYVGILIAPWFMNLLLLPGPGEDWSADRTGTKALFHFPSGPYSFTHMSMRLTGPFKGCSLFSPMGDFESHEAAVAVARAAMAALFDPENREDTDRRETIRAQREAEVAAAEATIIEPPTPEAGNEADPENADSESAKVLDRRALFTGRAKESETDQ